MRSRQPPLTISIVKRASATAAVGHPGQVAQEGCRNALLLPQRLLGLPELDREARQLRRFTNQGELGFGRLARRAVIKSEGPKELAALPRGSGMTSMPSSRAAAGRDARIFAQSGSVAMSSTTTSVRVWAAVPHDPASGPIGRLRMRTVVRLGKARRGAVRADDDPSASMSRIEPRSPSACASIPRTNSVENFGQGSALGKLARGPTARRAWSLRRAAAGAASKMESEIGDIESIGGGRPYVTTMH